VRKSDSQSKGFMAGIDSLIFLLNGENKGTSRIEKSRSDFTGGTLRVKNPLAQYRGGQGQERAE
jgi:hypothetical protein